MACIASSPSTATMYDLPPSHCESTAFSTLQDFRPCNTQCVSIVQLHAEGTKARILTWCGCNRRAVLAFSPRLSPFLARSPWHWNRSVNSEYMPWKMRLMSGQSWCHRTVMSDFRDGGRDGNGKQACSSEFRHENFWQGEIPSSRCVTWRAKGLSICRCVFW